MLTTTPLSLHVVTRRTSCAASSVRSWGTSTAWLLAIPRRRRVTRTPGAIEDRLVGVPPTSSGMV